MEAQSDPFLEGRLQQTQNDDERWMAYAIRLAERGAGWVNPNPLVGCVIVRSDRVIGEGFHGQYGEAHAEVWALRDAQRRGEDVRGATMYVTLEPCTHHGKTPPCTPVVEESGVARVVIGMVDRSPQIDGAGVGRLQASGLALTVGVLEEVAAYQNRFFLHDLEQRSSHTDAEPPLPYVTAKVGVSRNDCLTQFVGKQTKVTGKPFQKMVHGLRQRHDAILVGPETVRIDNPRLNVRYGDRPRDPLRVILDAQCALPDSVEVFRDPNVMRVVDAAVPCPGPGTRVSLPTSGGGFSIRDVLAMLYEHGVQSVLIEGGAGVFTSAFREHLQRPYIQEWIIGRAPERFAQGLPFISDADRFYIEWDRVEEVQVGRDVVERYKPAS